MNCSICQQKTSLIFKAKVLNKYDVNYFKCTACGFVQTEEPYWLKEAYESAITSLDIGLVSRNFYLKENIPPIIDSFFPESKRMIDYGGGYGMFVRIMRDQGYNFYRQDIYCENLFAKYFDVSDTAFSNFDVLTAFEVFEHLHSPLDEIEKMFKYSENVIFSTVLIPADLKEFGDWWYVSPLIGQHISFYDIKTLQFIANKYSKKLYSNGHNLHVFSSKNIDDVIVKQIFNPGRKTVLGKIANAIKVRVKPPVTRQSLLQQDYKFIEEKLKINQ